MHGCPLTTTSSLGRVLRLSLAVALTAGAAAAQTVWFVDDDAAPGGNGSSWAQAFDELHDALVAAQPTDVVWVAAGLYQPSPSSGGANPRTRTFDIPHDVNVLGGFAGNETSFAQRAGLFGRTLLDGDIGVPGDASDNCFHVLRMRGGSAPGYSILDGFVIQNGNALGSGGGVSKGGGVNLDLGAGANWGPALELRNCTLRRNFADYGAAISSVNLAHIKLQNCEVLDNIATTGGGGLYLVTALVTSVNVRWARNTAMLDGGGAVYHNSTTATWTLYQNNVFHDNRAPLGGAVKLHATGLTKGDGHFENCTFAFNSAAKGGAIHQENGFSIKPTLELYNSIVWRNTAPVSPQLRAGGAYATVSFCDVQGGFNGVGNIDADPRFLDVARRNLRIAPGSPAADAGNSTLVGADRIDIDGNGLTAERLPLDFDLEPRIVDDPAAVDTGVAIGGRIVDMGAFEN